MIHSDILLKTSLGDRFKTFRSLLGMTQKELARHLGLTQTAITGIEKGKSFPSLPTIHYLMKHFSLSPGWLLTGEGNPLDKKNQKGERYIKISGEFRDEIADLCNYLMEIPPVRDFILEQFVVYKLRKKSEIIRYLKNRKIEL